MTTTTLGTLADTLRGRLITPGDDDYDDARTLFYGGMDPSPGRDRPGRGRRRRRPCRDRGTRRRHAAQRAQRRSQRVGPERDRRRARDRPRRGARPRDRPGRAHRVGGGGLTAEGYTRAAAEHGLGTGFGDAGSVGLGGITLGGGVGFLSRPHGLTIDSLLAAEIVTADGERQTVDAERDPDLFWAIRGGGGNFGVATRFTLPAARRRHGRRRDARPAGHAETIAAFVAAAQAAPDELTTIANVMPARRCRSSRGGHGSLVILAMVAYVGDVEAGERAIAPLRASRPRSPTWSGRCLPRDVHARRGGLPPDRRRADDVRRQVGAGRADTIMEHLEASTATMRVAQIRVLGGAVARVPNDATAFAHRDRAIMVNTRRSIERPGRRARARGLGGRVRRRRSAGDDDRRVRELPRRRGRGARPRRPTRADLGPARADQGARTTRQPVPPQPEHPAGEG